MRPALQRLLSRPTAPDLLRYIVYGRTRQTLGPVTTWPQQPPCDKKCRRNASTVVAFEPGLAREEQITATKPRPRAAEQVENEAEIYPEPPPNGPVIEIAPEEFIVRSNFIWGPIGEAMANEMKLAPEIPSQRPIPSSNLHDLRYFESDMNVWASMLEHHVKENGYSGALKVWKAMQSRQLILPIEGPLAERTWSLLLEMGLRNYDVLEQICDYADQLFQTTGKRWLPLYSHIMRGISLKVPRQSPVYWHNRLLRGGHALSPKQFQNFMRTVVDADHDLKMTKAIYRLNKHRNAYFTIMKALLTRDDLPGALEWHSYLIRSGDFPHGRISPFVEPLVDYLVQSSRSLEHAIKLSIALIETHNPPTTSIMTIREIMNLSQGEAFNIKYKPKEYNDSLGARWLATRWFSLDFAVNALSGLGVQNIGPISLQAIGLREPNVASVLRRVEQLDSLGISIGRSVFSRALLSFAKSGDQDSLIGLLESDQHPEALEDENLQRKLLANYAAMRDWDKYRRTLAVQLAVASNPVALKHDLALRSYATNGSWSLLLQNIENMHQLGIPVQQQTTEYIIKTLLGRRRHGKEIARTGENMSNLDTVIGIMIGVLRSNGRVWIFRWREVFYRLGMFGKLHDLQRVSLWLASWYGQSGTRAPPEHIDAFPLENPSVRAKVKSWPKPNPTVNLHSLFPPTLQQTIIKWGFIHTNPRSSSSSRLATATLKDIQLDSYVRGVRIVRNLREKGVDVKTSTVRSALRNRCVVLFGVGSPLLRRNRLFRDRNLATLEELIERASREWGQPLWSDAAELKVSIARMSRIALVARASKKERKAAEFRTRREANSVVVEELSPPISFLGEG